MELTARMAYEYALRKPVRDAAEELDLIKEGIRTKARKGEFCLKQKYICPLNLDYLKQHGFSIEQEDNGDYIISWISPNDKIYH